MSNEVDAKAGESEAEQGFRMALDVSIEDAGPCRKHVRVKIPQADIEHYREEAVKEYAGSAVVPGFRVGRVPSKLVERRFRKELADQVRQRVLVQSLEQLAEDNSLDPINEPNFNIEGLELPDEGDFEYEFDVEVRPEFELPDYTGLTIKRPTREVSEADVDAYLERFLAQYGQLVPVEEAAQKKDFVQTTITFTHNGEVLRRMEELTLQLKPVLRFQDAELNGFDDLLEGVKAGESREADLTIAQESEVIAMRGEQIHAVFEVLDVKRLRLPELTKDFLTRIGSETEEELRDQIRSMLERQITYQQRQSARSQVIEKITESATWDLPEELVRKQVENALRREILEMQQAGFTTRDIRARENEIRQRSISTTRQALKEHFVLDKLATQENIEVTPQDIETEIAVMAIQRGESPRRMRARLVKSGVIENLEAQIRERKAVDFLLGKATYEDVEMEPPAEERIEAVSQSVCGTTTAAVDLEETGEEG